MPVLSPDDAAKQLGISRRTVMRRLADGTLTGQKDAGRWLVDVPETGTEAGNLPDAAHIAHVAQLSQQVDTLRAELAQMQDKERALRTAHDQEMNELRLELAAVETARAVAEAHLSDVTAERDRLLAQAEETQRQVTALTGALFQMTQRALPAPGKRRAWWRFWEREPDEPQT